MIAYDFLKEEINLQQLSGTVSRLPAWKLLVVKFSRTVNWPPHSRLCSPFRSASADTS